MHAAARLTALLSLTPLLVAMQADSAAHWRRVGLDHASKGDLKSARPALEKACALETPAADSCYYLGRVLFSLNEFEAARAAFDLAPPSGRLYRGAALNYVALGLNQEAELSFRKAIELGEDEARIDLGAFLFRQSRMDEAAALLDRAVHDNPASARANLESGRLLLQLGRLPEAAKRLEKATERNPADPKAHLLLGRAYQRMGRDAEAARELRLAESAWQRQRPPSR